MIRLKRQKSHPCRPKLASNLWLIRSYRQGQGKNQKEKKRRRYQEKQDRQKRQDESPAVMGVNAAKAIKSQKKWYNGQGPKKDISKIICYNCNKKCYYSKDYIELKN